MIGKTVTGFNLSKKPKLYENFFVPESKKSQWQIKINILQQIWTYWKYLVS